MTYSEKANPNATNSELDAKRIIKRLNDAQFDSIAERFAELVVDGMDMKSLVSYVIDDLTAYYEKCGQHELRELVDEYDEELWDEMVDDVQDVTVLDINNTGGKY